MIEAALKAQKCFGRQAPKGIAAPIGDVVAGEKTLVVLLDAVPVDRVI
jgi:hypothetical protein